MMFDQPPSLPIRAAIASFLGGLFGIGLILATHTAQAQTAEPVIEKRTESGREIAGERLRTKVAPAPSFMLESATDTDTEESLSRMVTVTRSGLRTL